LRLSIRLDISYGIQERKTIKIVNKCLCSDENRSLDYTYEVLNPGPEVDGAWTPTYRFE